MQLGIKPLPEALAIARELDLDLVEVAPNANPPVCRIMDFGKFKFDEAQRAKESRRKAVHVGIKEMKYRPKIGPGDFDTKTRQVAKFLAEGHKVKITIMFRGREVYHPEHGKRILDRIAEQMEGVAKVEAEPKLDNRNMIMVLAPDKRARQAAQSRATNQQRADKAGDARPRPRTNGSIEAVGEPVGGLGGVSDGRHQPKRDDAMPKMKTDRGAAKRIKVTGTGRLRRRKAFRSHLLEKKTSVRTRRLGRDDRGGQGGRPLRPPPARHLIRPTRRALPCAHPTHRDPDERSTPMARVKRSVHGRKHHRAVLEQAKGYYGNKSRTFRAANEQLLHSMQYAFRDRRARKGDFRKLWIQRINAGARQHGLSYSRLINGLHMAGVEVDRKVLADLAVNDPEAFGALVATAQDALAQARGRRPWRESPPDPAAGLHAPAGPPAAPAAPEAFGALGRAGLRGRGPRARPRRAGGGDARRVALRVARRRPRSRHPGGVPAGRRRRGPGLRPRPRRPRAGGRHGHAPAGPRRGAHARRAGAGERGLGPRRGALVVVLVDVRDPGNAGTVLRAADAAGAAAVVFAGESVDPYNPKTVRASAGSLFHVPLSVRPDALAVAEELSAAGFRTLATVVRGGSDYAELDWSVPSALFLGNESAGLDATLCAATSGTLSIPMAGRAESLNVGVAGAVVCFEAFRQRRGGGAGPRSMP